MVKNTQGGKHKNQARKNMVSNKGKLRLPSNDYELFAKVVRMCGGKICDVVLVDGKELKCNIRGKFSGKHKRSCIIQAGSVVLIGLQDWQSDITRCDLLEVYDFNELHILAGMPELDSLFTDSSCSDKVHNDVVVFENSIGISYDTFIAPSVEDREDVGGGGGGEINFDDI